MYVEVIASQSSVFLRHSVYSGPLRLQQLNEKFIFFWLTSAERIQAIIFERRRGELRKYSIMSCCFKVWANACLTSEHVHCDAFATTFLPVLLRHDFYRHETTCKILARTTLCWCDTNNTTVFHKYKYTVCVFFLRTSLMSVACFIMSIHPLNVACNTTATYWNGSKSNLSKVT